jgi:phage terminase large subunit
VKDLGEGITLLPRQADFITSPAKYRGYLGGVGAGKTHVGSIAAIAACTPGQDGMVVSATYPMMRDSTQRSMFDLLHGAGIRFKHLRDEESALINGARVLFRSGDEPDRLRGPNLAWCWIDEAGLCAEDVWRIVMGRLRVGPRPRAWVTSTPHGAGSWLHRCFVLANDPDYQVFTSATRENTFLSQGYVEGLERQWAGTPWGDQELLGKFTRLEGLVFPQFAEMHVVESHEVPASWETGCAIDFGYTNPFCALFGAADSDGRIVIYDEWYAAQTLLLRHAAEIAARGPVGWYVSDHDSQDNAELRALGIFPSRAKKDVSVGLQRIAARLAVQGDGRPRLTIFKTCTNLIRELGSYVWQPEREGKDAKEEPSKVDDHAVDALRYLVMRFDRKVEPIMSLFEAVRMGGAR